MSLISDLISQQATAALGNVQIPANLKNQVLSGLSDSVLSSLTQTAAKAGGVDQIKQLLSGATSAASSPITALASKLFTNKLSGLNLGASSSAVSSMIPAVMSKLSSVIKDKDGDGDVDLNDIILSLKGGSSAGSGILGAATGILGSLLKKR